MIRFFEHIKTGNIYSYIGEAICTTNSVDNTILIIYKKDNKLFAREKVEFFEKFIEVPNVW